MGLKHFRPTTASQRQQISLDYSELKDGSSDKKRQERKKSVRGLSVKIKKTGGRNNQGKVTSRFRGGGAKRIYKIIDFLRRDKENIPARVDFLDYDSNRNCFVALLVYADGEKRYILATKNMKPGDVVMCGSAVPIADGNAMPLICVPLGMKIHNLEMLAGKGAQLVRVAGQSAQLVAKEKGMAAVRLPSGELRWLPDDCYATLGEIGNEEFNNQNLGKAGRKRWKGIKPHIRGSAMNPNDHKHGGGEGKCPIGAASPYTFAGKPHGRKTRNKKKNSNKMIIARRKNKHSK